MMIFTNQDGSFYCFVFKYFEVLEIFLNLLTRWKMFCMFENLKLFRMLRNLKMFGWLNVPTPEVVWVFWHLKDFKDLKFTSCSKKCWHSFDLMLKDSNRWIKLASFVNIFGFCEWQQDPYGINIDGSKRSLERNIKLDKYFHFVINVTFH